MDIKNITLLVDLTKAKVDILKMKADVGGFWRYVDPETAEQLDVTLLKIDKMLEDINQ